MPRVLVPLALATAALAGCPQGADPVSDGSASDTSVAPSSDGGGDDADTTSSCHDLRRKSDGSCCPCGTLAGGTADEGECVGVGPESCAHLCDALFDAPASCVPTWAGASDVTSCLAGEWSDPLRGGDCVPAGVPPGCDADDTPCIEAGWRWTEVDAPGEGRLCRADEWDEAGCCPAGQWADPSAAGACRPAGVPPSCTGDDALDCLEHDWLWKMDASGDPSLCTQDDSGCCAPGEIWRADSEACQPAGLDESWCPDGFVFDEPSESCAPDPADCVGQAPPADAIVVDSSAALETAVGEAASGATIFLLDGDYEAELVIDRTMTLMGACAGQVRLSGVAGATAVLAAGSTAADVKVRRLTLSGPSPGVVASNGGAVTVERVWFDQPLRAGVQLLDGAASATVLDSVVREPVEDDSGHSRGIEALDGEAILGGVRVERALDSAVFANPGGSVSGSDLVTVGPGGAAAGSEGIECSGGAVALERVGVFGASSVAIYLDHDCVASFLDLRVDRTRLTLLGGTGDAMEIRNGASATLRGASLRRSQRLGIFAEKGARLDAAGLRIDGTGTNGPHPLADGGTGLFVQLDSEVTLTATHIVAYEDRGIVASTGTHFTASGLVVSERRPLLSIETHGMDITNATVDITGARFAGALAPRILVGVGDQPIVLRGVSLSRGAQDLGESANGVGIQLQEGSTATLLGMALRDARLSGVAAINSNTHVRAVGLSVERTTAGYDGLLGEAVFVSGGAEADVLGLVASDAAEAAVAVLDGSVLYAAGLTARQVIGHVPPRFGSGHAIVVEAGSMAQVDGGHFSAATASGAAAFGEGSVLGLLGVHISDTRPVSGLDIDGLGVEVSGGTSATVRGSVIADNLGAGTRVSGLESSLLLEGSIVRGTRPQPDDDLFGMGVLAAFGADLTARANLITDNATGGVSLYVAGGLVEDCVVRDVVPGTFLPPGEAAPVELGDGILVHDAFAGIELRRNIVVGSPRAGLLVDRGSCTVSGQILTGNLYGIVTQDADFVEGTELVTGNTLQDRAGELGLNVGPPPAAADLAGGSR